MARQAEPLGRPGSAAAVVKDALADGGPERFHLAVEHLALPARGHLLRVDRRDAGEHLAHGVLLHLQVHDDPVVGGDPRSDRELEHGDCVAVDGERLGPVELLTRLNAIAGEHGVGRVDLVENRFVGMKSRGVYETPGGTVLHAARAAVESLTLDREALRLRHDLMPRYAALVYNGFWFSPEREALQRLVDDLARPITGTARIQLYKGTLTVLGRKAPRSLYRPDIVTFEEDSVYDQRDAQGFIKLNALRLRLGARARNK